MQNLLCLSKMSYEVDGTSTAQCFTCEICESTTFVATQSDEVGWNWTLLTPSFNGKRDVIHFILTSLRWLRNLQHLAVSPTYSVLQAGEHWWQAKLAASLRSSVWSMSAMAASFKDWTGWCFNCEASRRSKVWWFLWWLGSIYKVFTWFPCKDLHISSAFCPVESL